MSHKKKLIENISSLMILQGANYALPLITIPYLVRVLGPERFGLLAFSQAFIQYFVILTDYGFNLTATRQIAIHHNDNRVISEVLSRTMLIKSGLMVISFLLVAGIVAFVPRFHSNWQLYLISFLLVPGNVLFPVWFFQGMEKMRYITTLNVTGRLLATTAIFIFVHKQSDFLIAALLQSMGVLIAGILSTRVVWRDFPVTFIWPSHWSDITAHMKDSTHVFIASLAGNVYGQGGVLITGLIAGPAAAGFYSIAQKIVSAIVGLVQPIAQGLYPHLCKIVASQMDTFQATRKQVLCYGGVASVALGISLLFLAVPICRLATGGIHSELIILVKISSLILPITMMNILSAPFMLAMKKFASNQKLSLGAALFFLVFSIPATKLFGSTGMAFSMFFVESIIFIGILFITRLAAMKDLTLVECHDPVEAFE